MLDARGIESVPVLYNADELLAADNRAHATAIAVLYIRNIIHGLRVTLAVNLLFHCFSMRTMR